MEFLLQPAADTVPSEAELQQYLDQHAQLYAVEPSWTFTHVFVDPAQRGEEGAQRDAVKLLATLNREHAGFNDSPRHTDRFAFLQNYVERTPEYIASQFGAKFMQSLQQLPVDARTWQGPLQSDQGWHLVLLTAHTPGRAPTVAEIRERLLDDVKRDRAARGQQQAIDALVGQYRVDLRDVEGRGGKASP
jgi:parvulin-like peptidyl-prolyl isomerase